MKWVFLVSERVQESRCSYPKVIWHNQHKREADWKPQSERESQTFVMLPDTSASSPGLFWSRVVETPTSRGPQLVASQRTFESNLPRWLKKRKRERSPVVSLWCFCRERNQAKISEQQKQINSMSCVFKIEYDSSSHGNSFSYLSRRFSAAFTASSSQWYVNI